MKMYRADTGAVEVTEHAVLQQTEKSIVYLVPNRQGEHEQRIERITTKDHHWFRSRVQAVDWLKHRTRNNIIGLEKGAEYLRKKLEKLV